MNELELQIIMFALVFLSIIILGIVLYVYLRHEQNKFLPPMDMYDVDWIKYRNKYQKKTPYKWMSSEPLNRALIMFFTYGLAPIFIFLLTTENRITFDVSFLKNFLSIIGLSIMLFVMSPFFLPMFPSGLFYSIFQEQNENSIVLLSGYVIYFIIIFSAVFAVNRRIFNFIYLLFIMLLVMNVVGCSEMLQDIDLSAIN